MRFPTLYVSRWRAGAYRDAVVEPPHDRGRAEAVSIREVGLRTTAAAHGSKRAGSVVIRRVGLTTAVMLTVWAVASSGSVAHAQGVTVGTIYPVPQLVFGGIACPSTSSCEAVAGATQYGDMVTVTNGVPGLVQSGPGNPDLAAVACPTTTTCEAVGGNAYFTTPMAVTITNGTPGTAVAVPGVYDLSGVACVTAASCLAVGYDMDSGGNTTGVLVPITDGTPGTAIPVFGTTLLDAVSCPTSTSCFAAGYESATGFDSVGVLVPVTNGSPGLVQTAPGTANLAGLTCQAPTTCTAVGYAQPPETANTVGTVTQIVNGTPAATVPISATTYLYDVDCPVGNSGSTCLAVGTNYFFNSYAADAIVVPLSSGTPGSPVTSPERKSSTASAAPTARPVRRSA